MVANPSPVPELVPVLEPRVATSIVRRLNLFRFYFRACTYLLPVIAFVISGALTWRAKSPMFGNHDRLELLIVLSMVWAVATRYFKFTSIDELFIERTGGIAALKALCATYVISFSLLFLLESPAREPLFYLVDACVMMVLALLMKAVFRSMIHYKREPIKILVIGADRFAHAAAMRLAENPISTCEIVGFVQLPGQSISVGRHPVLDLDGIEDIRLQASVDDIVIALPSASLSELPRLIRRLERLAIPIRAIVDFGEGVFVRENLFSFGGLQLLDLGVTPAESYSYLLLKRAFDVVFSLGVLIVGAPVMIAIVCAVKISSPGPVLFAQERVGLNGKIFKMYKFRSMRHCADNEGDFRWTVEDDPRCTPIGKFLRATSLDELPQFFNVLKGDMSVVGPRPERPHFVRQFLSNINLYNTRHRLNVGITGWAQVNGWRGDTSIKKRLECDLYYLQNWSFGFDLKIILMTALHVITRRNAY